MMVWAHLISWQGQQPLLSPEDFLASVTSGQLRRAYPLTEAQTHGIHQGAQG